MRLLAIGGSMLLLIYIFVFISLTATNVSKLTFALSREGQSTRFWARQGLIFLWPLVIISSEGRQALNLIWNWKDEEL